MHIFPCTLTAKYIIFETTAQIPEVEYGIKYGYFPEGKYPTLTFSYYWTFKNEHIATKYVIISIIKQLS